MKKDEEKGIQLTSTHQSLENCIDFTAFIVPLDWLEQESALVVHDNNVLENHRRYQNLRMWCEFSSTDEKGNYALEMIFYQGEERRPPGCRLERDKIAETYIDQGFWLASIRQQLTKEEVSRLGGGELFDLELSEELRIQVCIGRTCSVSTLIVETVFYSL